MSGSNSDDTGVAKLDNSNRDSGDYMRMIPVDSLYFDPDNPRLPNRVDGTDQDAVLAWMLQDAGLVELMTSIATVGFFRAEPLLVTPRSEGGHTVLEGNRRLAAAKLLRDPRAAPTRSRTVSQIQIGPEQMETLEELPCIIFEDVESIQNYLGYRHVTGVKEWEPAAKARYLERLYEFHEDEQGDEIYRYLARVIGSRSDYVRKLLLALKLFDVIIEASQADEEDVHFSLITLALNYTEIQNFVLEDSEPDEGGLNRRRVSALGEWMFRMTDSGDTQLGDSRNMRLLAKAIGADAGRAALFSGASAADAAFRAVDTRQLSRTYLEHALRDLDALTQHLEHEEAQGIQPEPPTNLKDLIEHARILIFDALWEIDQ